MKITETETESELRQIEQTTTVEKIKCDVCAHTYAKDEWTGNEFSINPSVDRESHALGELERLFDSYHVSIPKDVVDDGYDGYEMKFDVPKKELFDVINEEIEVARVRQERSTTRHMAVEQEKKEYGEKIGSDNFYLVGDEIHHFRYVLNVEATTDDHKHVCEDCYDVVFD